MRAISLMYHDIIDKGGESKSGFPGADADLYKVTDDDFATHLELISKSSLYSPGIVNDVAVISENGHFFITFDDGGKAAHTNAARHLDKRKWKGHFFVATDHIGTPTFLSADEIKDLDKRGHIIGSHSASHPLRMADLSFEEICREWKLSTAKLSDILGKHVVTASVPGGLYSKQVAEAAEQAGIKFLFNSEPVTKFYKVGDMFVLGRYTIQKNTSTKTIEAITRNAIAPRAQQFLFWNAKKVFKKVGGQNYLRIRQWIFSRNKGNN